MLDALAIRTSHVLTVLPGSSLSAGAWEEIRYGGALGRSFLFLFRRGEEVKFQETLRSLIANLSTHPFLVFATFRNNQDLFEQMKMVWGYVAKEPVTEDNWNDYVKSLLQEPEFERFKF